MSTASLKMFGSVNTHRWCRRRPGGAHVSAHRVSPQHCRTVRTPVTLAMFRPLEPPTPPPPGSKRRQRNNNNNNGNSNGNNSSSSSSSSSSKTTTTTMTERSRGINSESASLSSLDDLERVDNSVKYQVTRVLGTLDENGLWTVLSCLSVYGIFLLETFNYEKLGGWDVLYRDDIAWYNLLFPISALQGIENVLNTVFIFELVARGYSVGFNRSFFLSPYTWVDALVCLPPLVSPDIDGLRLLRVLRVLRLLRLLDRRADSVLFGFIQTKETEVQLIGILAEFVCIFCITAGVIYDLEVQVNTDVNTLADCLYWSFLTLTGIGQPFEIVTPGGKVATVIAVCVALLVVPGQLAKLAAISGSKMISEMMEDEEDDSYDEDERAAVVASKPVTYTGALPGTIAGGMGSAAAQMVKNKVKKRYRRRLVDKRVCGTCELRSHDVDATFCRRCGAELGD